jgi:predicted HicB family RNase H-like nuclease
MKQVITIRLSPEEVELIKEAARKDSRSVNQWSRIKLLEAVKNNK